MNPPPDVNTQLAETASKFETMFGRAPTHAAVAPGRVNLIGEHTDYNGGFVLPMAIERQTVIVAAPRDTDDKMIRLRSTKFDSESVFESSADLTPAKGGDGDWSNYIRGVVVGAIERGERFDPGGFEALIDSTVPSGGGLSSSASLEVAAATLIESLTGNAFDPVDKALLAQKCEHDFAGTPCGIMDQFISAMGVKDHALLLDCRSHETRAVPLVDAGLAIVIIDTKAPHELNGGEYAERRSQCEAAAKALGVELLRDATIERLCASGLEEKEPVVFRRARHVIGEIDRTLRAVEALDKGDYAGFGGYMVQSHDALRDDYEVSTPELDLLVRLAMGEPGVYGSRMTGGGFGGCTVTLVKADEAAGVIERVTEAYLKQTGVVPEGFVTRAAGGARILAV